jgi:hypothetical protein
MQEDTLPCEATCWAEKPKNRDKVYRRVKGNEPTARLVVVVRQLLVSVRPRSILPHNVKEGSVPA